MWGGIMGEPTPFGLAFSQKDSDPTGQGLVDEVATGWLADYVEYGTQITDAPPIFHLAVGISMLATACGNRVTFVGGGNRTHWPNLYILFVAPSGLMRKSTSIDIGLNLLRKINTDLVLPNETSREEFLRMLSGKPEAVIRESEFASALARYDRDYMGGMKQLLTDLWDCQDEYTRRIKGREGTGEKLIIKRPSLNYLAASTVEWLIDALDENDLKSGFLARFLIFPASSEGQWVSFFADCEADIEGRLLKTLAALSRMPGATVDFRPVYKPFNAWGKEMKELARIARPEMGGFYSRLSLFTAKLMAVMLVSEQGAQRSYVAEEKHLDAARTLGEWLRVKYDELLEQKLVFSREERIMQKILDTVRKDGKAEWHIALKRSHLKAADFERYMTTLLQRNEIKVVSESTRGRPAKMIHLHQNGYVAANVEEFQKVSGGQHESVQRARN